jgi:hypothetical protein
LVGQRVEILGRPGDHGRGEGKDRGGKQDVTMAHEIPPVLAAG